MIKNIKIEGLFGSNINLELKGLQRLTFLLGENGSFKTTTLRIISSLIGKYDIKTEYKSCTLDDEETGLPGECIFIQNVIESDVSSDFIYDTLHNRAEECGIDLGNRIEDFRILSDGMKRKQILIDAVKVIDEGGLILLDCPEAHLQLDVQRDLMENLMQIRPDVQFIVVTHAPEIIARLINEPECKYFHTSEICV